MSGGCKFRLAALMGLEGNLMARNKVDIVKRMMWSITSFDPIRVQISAPFMKDQFRRSPVAVGHKGDLSVKHLKKVVASALRENLDISSV